MCLKQELKLRSKNINPKIKNLKITIFSNPAISSNPKNLNSIKSIQKYNTTNPNKKISKSEQPISFKKKPSKPISFKRKPSKPT